MQKTERIKWIDVAKCFGIFAIYLGHFATQAGQAYQFVFYYHVALFFFLSGCLDYYDKEQNIIDYIVKKFKVIMIPFFVFSVLSIVLLSIQNNLSLLEIKDLILLMCNGSVRNTFFAQSLWFLPCLFLMQIIFKILKKIKYKYLILAICFSLFILTSSNLFPNIPSWSYNLDSALYYIVFFAIGYIFFPIISKTLKVDTTFKKVFFCISGLLSSLYALYIFTGHSYILGNLDLSGIFGSISVLLGTLILIWFNLILAKIFENILAFSKVGKETLYLCCNEFILKVLVVGVLASFGLSPDLSNPLNTFVYSIILIVIAMKWLIPFEKNIVKMVLHKN